MAIDRDATLKKAEKLLRQGKLDGAIEEYVRLVEEQPRDWNSINALGDLYVRAGAIDRAVTQFTRIADYLYGEGFLPKAAALYKKALKIQADHEHTLLRLSDIAARQGLLADAKLYLRQLARHRRERGDARGEAECLILLGGLDEDDGESRVAAARAAQALEDHQRAATLFKEAGDAFEKQKRHGDALDARVEAATLDPLDAELRTKLARDCVAAGQLERARAFLTRETAGDDPDLLMALGRVELAAGNERDARAMLTRVLMIAPERHAEIAQLADDLAAAGQSDSAYGCVEVVADAALLAGDWDRAIGDLRQFLRHGAHIPALSKLVEVSVDAGQEDLLREAQASLADAYLDAGRGGEARVIAEDLVASDPTSEEHRTRFRRALDQLGIADADGILAQYSERGAESILAETLQLSDLPTAIDDSAWAELPADDGGQTGRVDEATLSSYPSNVLPVMQEDEVAPSAHHDHEGEAGPLPAAPQLPSELTRADRPGWMAAAGIIGEDDQIDQEDEQIDHDENLDGFEVLEVDLSDALSALSASPPLLPAAAALVAEESPTPARDLEMVFADMRTKASSGEQVSRARAQYERGLEHIREGRLADAIAELQEAVRLPMLRFSAATALGRLHFSRGELQSAVQWLERAAEAPPTSPEEGLAVLYELAVALERMGERERALALLLELDADAAGYRDVRERIGYLTREQAGSREA